MVFVFWRTDISRLILVKFIKEISVINDCCLGNICPEDFLSLRTRSSVAKRFEFLMAKRLGMTSPSLFTQDEGMLHLLPFCDCRRYGLG